MLITSTPPISPVASYNLPIYFFNSNCSFSSKGSLMKHRNCFEQRKIGTFLAGTNKSSPVLGFRAVLALRWITLNRPKPRISIESPFFKEVTHGSEHAINNRGCFHFCESSASGKNIYKISFGQRDKLLSNIKFIILKLQYSKFVIGYGFF